ncbi:MAG TPA: hypothetical protein VM286_07825 [Candidatus Thermoplasmatota archaeon]|nr:hypothetical protein [Candidatus Thermoplasmatota archaeon]
MKWGRILVAAAALAAGALLLADRLPGGATAAGPRIGMGVFLVTLGLLVLSLGAAPWVLRKTTQAEDYMGGCPVGARCACGHFNLKPRRACRECGAATVYPVS